MGRYFFDTDDGEHFVKDDEGVEFRTTEEAYDAAVLALPDMARDSPSGKRFWDIVTTVRDAKGRVVFKATLSLRTE